MYNPYSFYLILTFIFSYLFFYDKINNFIQRNFKMNLRNGIILGFLFYIIGFLLMNNNEIMPYLNELKNMPSEIIFAILGKFIFQISGLILTVIILKYLLGMHHFKDAIKNVFMEIFSQYDFLKGIDKDSLLKIANNISAANNDISFIDKTKDNESIEKLKNHFHTNNLNTDKNYIVSESSYKTTLLSNGIEIMYRKIKCRIIKEGKFSFIFKFTAPDDNKKLNLEDYTNARGKDRFNETSYNSLLKSSNHNDGFKLEEFFSLSELGDEKCIEINFSKIYTKINEEIEIEFSISHPFKLSTHEEIENYYCSTYARPHAVRYFSFQQERYANTNKTIPDITPIIYDENDNIIIGKYEESIYYSSYTWEIFYSQNQSNKISFKIK